MVHISVLELLLVCDVSFLPPCALSHPLITHFVCLAVIPSFACIVNDWLPVAALPFHHCCSTQFSIDRLSLTPCQYSCQLHTLTCEGACQEDDNEDNSTVVSSMRITVWILTMLGKFKQCKLCGCKSTDDSCLACVNIVASNGMGEIWLGLLAV